MNKSPPLRDRQHLSQTAAMLVLLISVLLGSITASAAPQASRQPQGMSWGELALLPDYCKDAAGILYSIQGAGQSPNAKRWIAVMGEDFWHMHHYCYGLLDLQRSRLVADPVKKKYLLQSARNQYTYIIRNASPDMVLMPEIWTRMGDVQNMLGDVGAALDAYETAITRKPDYWPAYQNEAEMYMKVGLKARGLETLLRGITADPGATELRNSYEAAGGPSSRLPPMPSAASSAPAFPASAADATPAPAAAMPPAASSPASAP